MLGLGVGQGKAWQDDFVWLEQRRRALELEEVTVLTLGAKPALHPNIDLPLGSWNFWTLPVFSMLVLGCCPDDLAFLHYSRNTVLSFVGTKETETEATSSMEEWSNGVTTLTNLFHNEIRKRFVFFFVCVLLKNIYLFIWLYWVLVAAAQDLGVAVCMWTLSWVGACELFVPRGI